MPGKMARSASRPPFGLPDALVAVCTSRRSCRKAGKARIFTPVWESSGESRLKTMIRSVGPGESHRSSNFQSDQFASESPSIGRRISRTLARFFFAVLIGVGTTLAWQSYSKEAKEVVTTWVPSLGWLLPVSATITSASTGTSLELGQQLKPIALDLALVRRSVEQLAADLKDLAAKQEQIAHDTATLQAVERDLRQNISSVPPPGAVQIPRPKPTQPSAQSLATH